MLISVPRTDNAQHPAKDEPDFGTLTFDSTNWRFIQSGILGYREERPNAKCLANSEANLEHFCGNLGGLMKKPKKEQKTNREMDFFILYTGKRLKTECTVLSGVVPVENPFRLPQSNSQFPQGTSDCPLDRAEEEESN